MSTNNWYFTADTNSKGYTYIKAYQTQWDPVRKRSRSINRRHVGRLHEDGHITPSAGFLEHFPQYAGRTLYYGADKQLVDEATYRRDFPDAPGPKRDQQDLTRLPTIRCGLTWAASEIAEQCGLYRDLVAVFGDKNARRLLDLAIYKHDQGQLADKVGRAAHHVQQIMLGASRRIHIPKRLAHERLNLAKLIWTFRTNFYGHGAWQTFEKSIRPYFALRTNARTPIRQETTQT